MSLFVFSTFVETFTKLSDTFLKLNRMENESNFKNSITITAMRKFTKQRKKIN